MKKQKKVTPRRLEHLDNRHWRTLDVLITDNGAVNSRSAIWILRTAGCAHGDARALIDHKIKTGASRTWGAIKSAAAKAWNAIKGALGRDDSLSTVAGEPGREPCQVQNPDFTGWHCVLGQKCEDPQHVVGIVPIDESQDGITHNHRMYPDAEAHQFVVCERLARETAIEDGAHVRQCELNDRRLMRACDF